MKRINLAFVLGESKPCRAFFIEGIIAPQRPSFFNSKKFEKLYGFNVFPNNLAKLAARLEKEFGETIMGYEGVSHKKRFWFVNRNLLDSSVFFPKLPRISERPPRPYNNLYWRIYSLLILSPKTVKGLDSLKKHLFENRFGSMETAFEALPLINFDEKFNRQIIGSTARLVRVLPEKQFLKNDVDLVKQWDEFLEYLKETSALMMRERNKFIV